MNSEFSNSQKAEHGRNAQDALENMLIHCKQLGYIKNYESNLRIGAPGYQNTTQFYAPYIVYFDTDCWILFSTTSFRSDRIKSTQWDSSAIKQFANNTIALSIVVYPDATPQKDLNTFLSYKNRYIQKMDYSTIDDIVSQSELFEKIENRFLSQMTTGQSTAIRGNNFEDYIAQILNYPSNLKKLIGNDQKDVGMCFEIFSQIISKFALQEFPNKIVATSDKSIIKRLPSGGAPKTDILVTLFYNNDRQEIYTISCKKSNCYSVSVHEYTADAFASVLDSENQKLKQLLNAFQKAGSYSAMGQSRCDELTQELKPYVFRLTLWALGGYFGEGDSSTQWAKYILTYKDMSQISIHSTEEYARMVLSPQCSIGGFGTPFGWTYPSKGRTKRIQLKCKIL